MWINLTPDEVEVLKSALGYRASQIKASAQHVSHVSDLHERLQKKAAAHDDLRKKIEESLRPGSDDDTYRNAVKTSDELEVDGDAIVSMGADPGAWVHAWVWVTNEAAGIEEPILCRTCGEEYPEGGDGFDGECPDCADKTDQQLHPENYVD